MSAVLEALPEPHLWVGADGGVQLLNRAALAIWGGAEHELRGRPLEIMFATSERVGLRALLARQLEQREAGTSLSLRGLTAAGVEVPWELTLMPAPGADQPALLVRLRDVVVAERARDSTEQLRAERALRESEQRFDAAFHALPYSVSVSDLKTGRYLDCNAAFERISGYRRDEVVGRTSHELNLWVDRSDRDELVRRISESGRVRGMEVRFRAKDGRVVVALCHCDVIEVAGAPCLLNTFEDVSERLRVNLALEAAEEARRNADALLATAFRAAPDPLAIVDLESDVYIEVNPAFENIYGYTRAEVIGETVEALGLFANPTDRPRLQLDLEREGRLREVELKARRKDGTIIDIIASAELIQLRGRPCLLRMTQDVTEKRRAEAERAQLEAQLRQAQKLEALGTLAGGIAHDFNNILMVSLNFADLALLDAEKPAAVREHVEKVIVANTRARDLVRQILAFSRRQKQERRRILLVDVVREALDLLQSTLPKSIHFETRFDPNTPAILADPTQMHQVVMNLCTNAAHALGRQPGTLAVTVECIHAEGRSEPTRRRARLSVRDTGSGMSEETMRHIFDPFFTTKGPGEGTGLGLSVVHGIVNDHEGTIRVRSTPGAGTTFWLEFPEHIPDALEVEPGQEEAPVGLGEHILVVDDEVELANSVQLGLERLGFKVTTCHDPHQALRLFVADPGAFRVVVTDLSMPMMNGLDLARGVLARCADKPVILLSGHSDVWTTEKVRAEGLRELVDKPVSLVALARALRRALGGESKVDPDLAHGGGR
jgi:PAS domain S-box-containing protein